MAVRGAERFVRGVAGARQISVHVLRWPAVAALTQRSTAKLKYAAALHPAGVTGLPLQHLLRYSSEQLLKQDRPP